MYISHKNNVLQRVDENEWNNQVSLQLNVRAIKEYNG